MKKIISVCFLLMALLISPACGKAMADESQSPFEVPMNAENEATFRKEDDTEPSSPAVEPEQPEYEFVDESSLEPVDGLYCGGVVWSEYRDFDSIGQQISEGHCKYYKAGKILEDIHSVPGKEDVILRYAYDRNDCMVLVESYSCEQLIEKTIYRYNENAVCTGYTIFDSSGNIKDDISIAYEYGETGQSELQKYYREDVLVRLIEQKDGNPVQDTKYYNDGAVSCTTTYKETESGRKSTTISEENGCKTVIRYGPDNMPLKMTEYDPDGNITGWTIYTYGYADETESTGGDM